MFETVKKADWQPGERKGCDLRRDGKEIQKKSRPLKDDIRVNMKPVMQMQDVRCQNVIQMAPYDSYLRYLQDAKREELTVLCDHLRQYIASRMAYEEKRREQDTDRKMELAALLNDALSISKEAGAIRMDLTDDDARLKDLLTDLGKFVHVELSPDETMSLGDLSDILKQTRALVDAQAGSSSESSVKGKDKVRELGLLSGTDEEERQRLVLMINGGDSLEGTGGSVTAPGESTPVFKDNWRDVRFIAHTHPNESRFQTDVEFKTDVEAANRESEKREGLKRAEMVQRDQIEDGIGGTIFYTGDGVLNKLNRHEQYTGGFAVTKDTIESVFQNEFVFQYRLSTQERKHRYGEFKKNFSMDMYAKIEQRDKIIDIISTQKLSAEQFLNMESRLAEFAAKNMEVFKEGVLQNKLKRELENMFPDVVAEIKAEEEARRAKRMEAPKEEEEEETEEFKLGDLF